TDKIVAELPVGPKTPSKAGMHGIAFSPDGKLLTVHHHSFGKKRLITWSMETGAMVAETELMGPAATDPTRPQLSNARPQLQWLPDNRGVLIYEKWLVDPNTGQ